MSEHQNGDGAPPDAPQDASAAQPETPAQPEQPALTREELERKVSQLSAMLEDSMSRARETQERLKDTHERLLRVAAEFDNFKKRATKERDDAQKFGIEKLLKDFLPVTPCLASVVSSSFCTRPRSRGTA